MKQNQLHKIAEILDRMVEQQFVSGASCLIWQAGSEQGYYEAGMADREQGKQIARTTIFRMYSMSKPVTAAAIMLLLESGLIDLAAPVADYIPEFTHPTVCRNGGIEPAARPVTIQHLLNMTSGYSYGGDADESEKAITALIDDIKSKLSTIRSDIVSLSPLP